MANGLKGAYYDNKDFTNLKLTRTDATVNFDWKSGSPNSSVGSDTFSVRWTGFVEPRFSESYTFYTLSDDGVRLWVGEQLLIDNWTDHAPTENSGKVTLAAGLRYSIKMEYYEGSGGAMAKLSWSSPSQAKQIIPQSQLFDTATTATALAAQKPKCADHFVDMIGVNTHWPSNRTAYVTNFSTVKQKLLNLGIRQIRDGGTGDDVILKMRELASAGIKTNFILDPWSGTKPTTGYWSNAPHYLINDFVKKVGVDVFESVESPNEINGYYGKYYWHPGDTSPLSNDPNSSLFWGKYARAIAQDLWKVLKGDSATAGIEVLGPSLTNEAAFVAVGDLTSYIDGSNIHYYLAGRHPGTPGWGSNGYGSLNWTISRQAHVQSKTKPISFTEWGYSNATALTCNPPEVVTGKYIPRALFLYLSRGIRKVYPYEFLDERPNPEKNDPQQHYGLLRVDLSEKPAYVALKNLITLLKDPGTSFTPGPLDYTLNGTTSNVKHLLLQKRDKIFYLILWVELPSYEPNTKAVSTVPRQPVTLIVPSSIKSATVYSLVDNGTMSSSATPISGGKISLSVPDSVVVVKLLPV